MERIQTRSRPHGRPQFRSGNNNWNPALGVLWSWHRVASPSTETDLLICFLSGKFDLWSLPPMDHKETTHLGWGAVSYSILSITQVKIYSTSRVRYDAVLIYKRRTEIWKDADFDTLPRPGDAFSNDFESHRPPSTPAPTTPALPTPLRPPPLRPPAVPAPYHTGPLRYRPPTEAILCEYSDCMYTQLLKLRYWISSPVKMIHVQYPKVNSITKKYFMEMNDRLQNLSILLHFRKIKYIDSKESWWTILYLIVWYEPLSCRWHSYAWPK